MYCRPIQAGLGEEDAATQDGADATQPDAAEGPEYTPATQPIDDDNGGQNAEKVQPEAGDLRFMLKPCSADLAVPNLKSSVTAYVDQAKR